MRFWLLATLLALGCADPGPPPHVVLVVLDTTRADRMSAYGHPQETTPSFDAFAERAILFERAYATSCWTVPSHASLFTGLWPVTHRATQERQYLADEYETLAELLRAAGYETAAFSNNAWVGAKTNLVQGFDRVHEGWRQRAPGQALRTNRAIERWLDDRDPGRRFFLFVNYIEPHWTYSAPREWQSPFVARSVSPADRERANFGVVEWYQHPGSIADRLLPIRRGLYDAEVAFADSALGELLELLRARGLEEQSLVVIASDHGENLGDNGHQGHSFALNEAAIRVPLAIRPPDGKGAGTLRGDPVQLTDVFAAIAARTGVRPTDERIVGRDLLSAPLPADRPVLAEYYYPAQFLAYFPDEAHERLAPYRRRLRALLVGPHKLVWGSDGRHEFYDLGDDPGELRDRFTTDPEGARRLLSRLEELVAQHRADDPELPDAAPSVDAETEASLRELGYVP